MANMQGHHGSRESNWPPILTARRVAAYAGRSLTSIDRAVERGELKLAGRVGGRGERTIRREDVDAWLLGATAANAPDPAPRSLPPRRTSANTTGDALERIARTAAGGGK